MTLSDLAKHSMIRSVARSLFYTWASCSKSYARKQKFMFFFWTHCIYRGSKNINI